MGVQVTRVAPFLSPLDLRARPVPQLQATPCMLLVIAQGLYLSLVIAVSLALVSLLWNVSLPSLPGEGLR